MAREMSDQWLPSVTEKMYATTEKKRKKFLILKNILKT